MGKKMYKNIFSFWIWHKQIYVIIQSSEKNIIYYFNNLINWKSSKFIFAEYDEF